MLGTKKNNIAHSQVSRQRNLRASRCDLRLAKSKADISKLHLNRLIHFSYLLCDENRKIHSD